MFGLPSWVAPVAGAVILGLVIVKSYSVGYDTANSKSEAAIAELNLKIEKQATIEMNRQIAANRAAEEQQKKFAEQMDEAEKQLADLRERNRLLALAAPDANETGLSAEAAKRLNGIR
jgi:hypothetical protein